MFFKTKKPLTMPDAAEALRDRQDAAIFSETHYALGTRICAPVPDGLDEAVFALGCFWGSERLFWQVDGVYSTAVGYAGGVTANPTYDDVCSGMTGHTEVVKVFFDPTKVSYEELLLIFWEAHDPTQGMRQGNDVGTQYRSAIYVTDPEQKVKALDSRKVFQQALTENGHSQITTEIDDLQMFYYADDFHQQYLAKNPNGYCGLAGTGVCYAKTSSE